MKKTSIRRDLFMFLKSPDYNKFEDISTKEKMIVLLKCLILTDIALVIAGLLSSILKEVGLISDIQMKSTIIFNTIKLNQLSYKPYFILSIIFFIPLIEELAYRLFLAKFRINYFIISISVLLGANIFHFSGNIFWIPKTYLLFSVAGYIYIILISAVIGGGLYLLRNQLMRLEGFWNQKMCLIFYATAILFSVNHLFNLKYENSDLFFMPIILLPFFLYGLSFGYLRIRLGILYSMALHFISLSLIFGLPELISLIKANPV